MVDQTRSYRLMEPVGHGSFGTVWRAIMETEGGFTKEVALKILRPEAAARLETVRRLRDEARLLGLLRHRSIVQVDGLVQVEGRWAVVMELVAGVSLNDLIPQIRMPLPVALEVLAEIGSALHDAYSQPGPDGRPLHLIHRDIKPSNVHLGASGGVKVLDFGIARADFDTREANTSSLMLGTLAYMAPERLDSIDGPEGDIYALGAMFYELLVGERIGKTSANPMRHELLHAAAIAKFAQRVGEGGAEAVELLGKMLAYEPRDRPTARELEITCRRIHRRLEGESLAEWAGREVPKLTVHTELLLEPEETQLTGLTLVEQRAESTRFADEGATEPLSELTDQSLTIHEPSVTVLPPPPPPLLAPSKTGPSPWMMTAVGVVAMLLGALLGATLLTLRRPSAPMVQPAALPEAPEALTLSPPEPSPMEPPEVEPDGDDGVVAAPEPPVAPPVLPTKESVKVSPELPKVKETPSPPAPVEPTSVEPVSVERAQPTGTVQIRGDFDSVQLVAADGTVYKPGPVPPGTYTVRAAFNGQPSAGAGEVVVMAGSEVVLGCNAVFGRCQAQ